MTPVNGYRIAEPRPHESGSGIGPANEWKITVGLIPGYRLASSGGWVHWGLYALLAAAQKLPIVGDLLEHAINIARHVMVRRVFNSWRMERAKSERMWVTGMIEYKEVLYTHKAATGWANAQEPVAVLEGIQSPLLNTDPVAWKDTVVDLATTLGRRLRQKRVYVQVGPEILVLEQLPKAQV